MDVENTGQTVSAGFAEWKMRLKSVQRCVLGDEEGTKGAALP